MRNLGGVALAHLGLCAVGLLVIKLVLIPLSPQWILHFVNVNMMLAAGAASASAGLALRRRDTWGEQRWFPGALFVSLALLLYSELVAWIGEFIPAAAPWLSPADLAPLASRLALALFLLAGLLRGPPGHARKLVLAGAALYLVSDLLFHLSEMATNTSFLLLEFGFYAAYWLMALGARWQAPEPKGVA